MLRLRAHIKMFYVIMYVIKKYSKVLVFFAVFRFLYILSTNIAENMNSDYQTNRILPYFEEVLVNAFVIAKLWEF